MTRQRSLIAAFPFLAFGAFFILATVIPTVQGRKTLFWETTGGRIVSAHDLYYRGHSRTWGTLRGDAYEVRYSYRVDGREYQSTKLSYRSVGYREFRRLGRPGDPVRVFYNPAQPSQSVLIPGEPRLAGSPLFYGGILLAAIGLALAFAALLRR